MAPDEPPVPLPPAIRRHVEDRVRRIHGSAGGDPGPEVAAVPDALPPGEVHRLGHGGPFGWLLDARLDIVDGRAVLEVLEDSRMSGPDHYAVHQDGRVEPLPTEETGYVTPQGAPPEEVERIREAYLRRNRAVADALRARGFRT